VIRCDPYLDRGDALADVGRDGIDLHRTGGGEAEREQQQCGGCGGETDVYWQLHGEN
jgi:hypothetical protein